MEYPTLFTGGTSWLSPTGSQSPESVAVHEFGHQIFHGLLASNEFDEAHLDEGVNAYAQDAALKAAFGDPVLVKRFFGLPVAFRSVVLPRPEFPHDRYQEWQLVSRSDATSVPTWSQLDGAAIRNNAYAKTALTLASAERTLGEATWAKVMKVYATRWVFRSPTAADFRAVVREVAGDAAEAFFRESWDSSNTFDYAVSKADAREIGPVVGWVGDGAGRKWAAPAKADTTKAKTWESVVVVRRMGEAVWPVDVELSFEGGHVVRRTWNGADRWIRYRCTGPKLLAARVDPDRKLLLDANLLNNGLKAEPDKRAAYVWASRLRFWAQNVLEFFALLGFAGAAP